MEKQKKWPIILVIIGMVLIAVGILLQEQYRKEWIVETMKKAAERSGLESVSVEIVSYNSTYHCTIDSSNFANSKYSEMIYVSSNISHLYDEECKEQGKERCNVTVDKFMCNGDTYEVFYAGKIKRVKKNGDVVWEKKEPTTTTQENTSSPTTQKNTSTCTYKYFDGSVCGAKTNKYTGLCDKHFEELYETYQSLGGTKVPKS